jgi:hypothetical protein
MARISEDLLEPQKNIDVKEGLGRNFKMRS